MNTIAERIYLFLKSNEINVFFPGQHKGYCEKPYVVVKQRNTDQVFSFSSNVTYFSLLCYVPDNSYSKAQEFADEIEHHGRKQHHEHYTQGNDVRQLSAIGVPAQNDYGKLALVIVI